MDNFGFTGLALVKRKIALWKILEVLQWPWHEAEEEGRCAYGPPRETAQDIQIPSQRPLGSWPELQWNVSQLRVTHEVSELPCGSFWVQFSLLFAPCSSKGLGHAFTQSGLFCNTPSIPLPWTTLSSLAPPSLCRNTHLNKCEHTKYTMSPALAGN